jgi:hypothetical protein
MRGTNRRPTSNAAETQAKRGENVGANWLQSMHFGRIGCSPVGSPAFWLDPIHFEFKRCILAASGTVPVHSMHFDGA